MRFASLGHPSTFGALPAAACFTFECQGAVFIGIKIVDEFATHPIASCAALWASRAALLPAPRILEDGVAPGTGVYCLAEAMIVPSTDPSCWQIGGEALATPGGVLLTRDRMLLTVARRNGKLAFVDLSAGRTVALPDNTALLHCGAWRLVQKMFDTYETLFHFGDLRPNFAAVLQEHAERALPH